MAGSYGRYNFGEKIQFLYYSRGSLFETKYWLNRAVARKLISRADHEVYANRLTDIARQTNSFVGYLKSQRSKPSSKSVREEQAPYVTDWPEDVPDPIFLDDDFDLLSRF